MSVETAKRGYDWQSREVLTCMYCTWVQREARVNFASWYCRSLPTKV